MAFQVGSTCYTTAQQALAASASNQVGAVVQHGGKAYIVAPSVAGDGLSYLLSPVDGGATIQTVVQLQPMPCGLLQAADGLVIGWGVAAVWLAVAAVMFMRRGVHS